MAVMRMSKVPFGKPDAWKRPDESVGKLSPSGPIRTTAPPLGWPTALSIARPRGVPWAARLGVHPAAQGALGSEAGGAGAGEGQQNGLGSAAKCRCHHATAPLAGHCIEGIMSRWRQSGQSLNLRSLSCRHVRPVDVDQGGSVTLGYYSSKGRPHRVSSFTREAAYART